MMDTSHLAPPPLRCGAAETIYMYEWYMKMKIDGRLGPGMDQYSTLKYTYTFSLCTRTPTRLASYILGQHPLTYLALQRASDLEVPLLYMTSIVSIEPSWI